VSEIEETVEEFPAVELSCEPPSLYFFKTYFTFRPSDIETTVVCTGRGYSYAFFYLYQGRPVSRKKLKIPSLKPCMGRPTEGCVRWVLRRGQLQAEQYQKGKWVRLPYTLPEGYAVSVRRIAVQDINGPPYCYAQIGKEAYAITDFASDTYLTVHYTKKSKQKGQHNLYLECHCNKVYHVSDYKRAIDLYRAIRAKIARCTECIEDYVDRTVSIEAVEFAGYECGTNFFIKQADLETAITETENTGRAGFCYFGRYFGQELQGEKCS